MPQLASISSDAPTSDNGVKPADWWHEADDRTRVVCDLCPRGCSLLEGKRGFCFVRQNVEGRMVTTTYGRSTGFCIDPIEKKPLNHFYPGSAVLSFGTAGCNLGCKFCQNWEISKSRQVDASGERADPETVARAAAALRCRSVAFTYNDPVVWAEYAVDCAKACRAAGLKAVAVTAGYIAPPARKTFFEVMDAANVDLKGFTEEFYRDLTNSHLAPVLDTLQWLVRESNVWLEVTNLVIPGKNDSEEELKRMCGWFVENLGPDVPLHFSAFHPDFRMQDVPSTPPGTLARAHDVAVAAGLNYVYTGNIVDRARQSTYCPGCKQVLIGRDGYRLTAYTLEQNRCRTCGWAIAGCFADRPGDWGPRRLPVRIAEYCGQRDCGPRSGTTVGRPTDKGIVRNTGNLEAKPAVASQTIEVEEFKLTPEQERLVFAAAGRRLFAEVLGDNPVSFDLALGDLAAKKVAGAFITLKRAGALRGCCGSLGDSIPLSEAIDRAAIAVAKRDPRFPSVGSAELPHLEMHVTLLHQMETVTAKGADRQNAVILGKHGLRIACGDKRGLLLPVVAVEHGLDAGKFLELVCRKAGLPADSWQNDDAVLTTFQGHAINGELKTLSDEYSRSAGVQSARQAADTAAPQSIALESSKPCGGGAVRLPAVAGMFYPRDAEQINRTLDGWFARVPTPETWAAALVPHAGWVYSGRLAADVFSRVKIPKRVVILAPKHCSEGADWAVAPHAVWQLPGARLDSDSELAGMLAQSIDGLHLDGAAHAGEHAIEVQLPLIARLAPHARVVGITIRGGKPEDLRRFAEEMAGVLAGFSERPLLVISSDMNHYADEGETRRHDRLALEALASLDPERFYRVVCDNRISMCGVLPAYIILNTLRCLGSLKRCCEVGYTTSAVVSHDVRRCVGYAGMLFA